VGWGQTLSVTFASAFAGLSPLELLGIWILAALAPGLESAATCEGAWKFATMAARAIEFTCGSTVATKPERGPFRPLSKWLESSSLVHLELHRGVCQIITAEQLVAINFTRRWTGDGGLLSLNLNLFVQFACELKFLLHDDLHCCGIPESSKRLQVCRRLHP
jgi:hypothetical protein